MTLVLQIQGPYGFWKVMESENAIFQDLECVEKILFLSWLEKSFGFLFGRIVNICSNGCSIVLY